MVALHGYRDPVVLVLHHLGGIGPELGGQYPVIGAWAPAPLHVAGNTDPGLDPGEGLDLPGDPVGGGGIPLLRPLRHPLLPLHPGLLGVHGSLSHRQNGEVLPLSRPALNGRAYILNGIGELRDKDDVRTPGDTGIEGKPPCLIAHQLHHHAAAVAAGGRMDPVDGLGGDLHGGVKSKGHISAENVIVDGLGQGDDVQPLLRQQVGCLVGPVAPQAQQAVQLHLLIVSLHGGHLVHLVLLHHTHQLEGGALGSQDGPAYRQDAGKLMGLHHPPVPVDESGIAVADADELHILPHALIQRLGHTPQGGVQPRAVAS